MTPSPEPRDRCQSPTGEISNPSCALTLDRIQHWLDGECNNILDESLTHRHHCRLCQDRLAAAQALREYQQSELQKNTQGLPPSLTSAWAAEIQKDRKRRRRLRRGIFAIATSAVAASLLWAISLGLTDREGSTSNNHSLSPLAPTETVKTHQAEIPRLDAALAEADRAIQDWRRQLSFPSVADLSITPTIEEFLPAPDKMSAAPDWNSARASLAELPDAAWSGIQPLAEQTTKVFARILQDLPSVSVDEVSKPKS